MVSVSETQAGLSVLWIPHCGKGNKTAYFLENSCIIMAERKQRLWSFFCNTVKSKILLKTLIFPLATFPLSSVCAGSYSPLQR